MTNHGEIAIRNPHPYEGDVTLHGTPRAEGRRCSVVEAANHFDLPPLLDRIGDWAICADGIHCLYMRYFIARSSFKEADWVDHVTEKQWVVAEDFIKAFAKASMLYAVLVPAVGAGRRKESFKGAC